MSASERKGRGRTAEECRRFLEENSIPEPNSGCLLWLGSSQQRGYGRMSFQGRLQGVHRVAWQVFRGEIPPRHFVCHKCDNPSCLNVDHLFLGTNQENCEDIARKWRGTHNQGRYGVRPHRGRYQAAIKFRGQIIYAQGKFDTPELANAAAVALKSRLYGGLKVQP